MSTSQTVVGVDVGATLCKLAMRSADVETARFASTDEARIRAQIEAWKPHSVVMTGGGAEALENCVKDLSVTRVGEFEAWARGAAVLAERADIGLPPTFLLVSVGTGTSVLWIDGERCERVGGSALGGGSLLGLGQLLVGTDQFAEIARLAQLGDRRRVDLLVGDIYRGRETPLPRETNAASFGKIDSREPEDLANSLMGLLGENIGLICGELARARGVTTIVYGGSTLAENPALVQTLDLVTLSMGRKAVFLTCGAYCGAVGAAFLG